MAQSFHGNEFYARRRSDITSPKIQHELRVIFSNIQILQRAGAAYAMSISRTTIDNFKGIEMESIQNSGYKI